MPLKVGIKQLVADANARIQTLSLDEAKARLGQPDVVFVDIRDPRELERDGVIPGAFHAPRGMLEFWVDPESPYYKPIFGEDKTFVLYCAGGLRSALSTATLQDMGLPKVCHVAGGFGAWRQGGGEIVPYQPRHKNPTQPGENLMPGTVRFHRVLKAPPERVYRAFLDPQALVKWLPPHGFTATVHSIDVRVGGGYRMSFTNFGTGRSHSFGCRYVELKPNKLIRYVDQFDDPNLPGEMNVTVALKSVMCGTELSVVQGGIPDVIPVEMCYLGWQESLQMLAQLVEPTIPDEG